MNHSLWELTAYTRHHHRELEAERRSCDDLSLLPAHDTVRVLRQALGLRLIAAGRALAGAEGVREMARSARPAL
ncbi:MAG: hypothetical protein QM692_01925 [Thermomicrobiales bacterium]